MVLNLLSNAIKFTPEGGRIDVGAGPADGLVAVSVRDTGIGIAPQDQEKVFEAFRRVGTAAKTMKLNPSEGNPDGGDCLARRSL